MNTIAVTLASMSSLTVIVGGIVAFIRSRTGRKIQEADETQTIADLVKRLGTLEVKLNDAIQRLARIEGRLWRGGFR